MNEAIIVQADNLAENSGNTAYGIQSIDSNEQNRIPQLA